MVGEENQGQHQQPAEQEDGGDRGVARQQHAARANARQENQGYAGASRDSQLKTLEEEEANTSGSKIHNPSRAGAKRAGVGCCHWML